MGAPVSRIPAERYSANNRTACRSMGESSLISPTTSCTCDGRFNLRSVPLVGQQKATHLEVAHADVGTIDQAVQLGLAISAEPPLRCLVDRHLVIAEVKVIFNLEELVLHVVVRLGCSFPSFYLYRFLRLLSRGDVVRWRWWWSAVLRRISHANITHVLCSTPRWLCSPARCEQLQPPSR